MTDITKQINKLATDALLAHHDTDVERVWSNLTAIRTLTEPLSVGDCIYINSNIRPKYLIGLKGTIVSINDKGERASVDILDLPGRFTNPVCLPVVSIERV